MSARPEMLATKGLPGCGKTTFAEQWVAEDRSNRARISRDDTRKMLHGGWIGTEEHERQVTVVTHEGIRGLLRLGVSVVEDSTNLDDLHLLRLAEIAEQVGAWYRVVDFTKVPFETCVARDARREGPARVGRAVILAMHQRYLQGGGQDRALPPSPLLPVR
ncbi:AAA family ATPase [Micromonospora lupini]|uniref:AAA family ATPase n=1 Tax=Micromonospora lupini TaxID=285679 RepID=UPI002257A9D6|nr:AAA family ATPase [Micromonospora lupini]MCX5066741.1 AAA family ATPase [Micromonospora lupini]